MSCCKSVDTRTARTGHASKEKHISLLRSFLANILPEAERFILHLEDSVLTRQAVAVTFLNSAAESNYVASGLEGYNGLHELEQIVVKKQLSFFSGCLTKLQDHYMDEGFTRMISTWRKYSPKGTPIKGTAASDVLETLYIDLEVDSEGDFSFYDLMMYQFRWISSNEVALEVFTRFSEGKGTMSAEQLGVYLRETQRLAVTNRLLADKLMCRYGGVVHRYNFSCYNESVLTNCAIDPTLTSDVYQDMTQPFTRYSLNCARIESPEALSHALCSGSVRALVLPELKRESCELNAEEPVFSSEFTCGTCKLSHLIQAVKRVGFQSNTYPIVICLPPCDAMPIEEQVELAAMLLQGFGSMLGSGLMLDGAVISDPKFSPGAQRNKVLLLGSQGELGPFIGFLVADMNRPGLGVRVTNVVEGTPAERGGIVKNDWLTHLNKKQICDKETLRTYLSSLVIGSEVEVSRENLEKSTIIVGGKVRDSEKLSAELGNLMFFRLTSDPPLSPWDTTVLTTTQLVSSSPPTLGSFDTHFGMVKVSAKDVDAGDPSDLHRTDVLGRATECGIQFIDIEPCDTCLAWSKGRFADNGGCGYLLRLKVEPNPVCLDLQIIVGPRKLKCPPLRYGTVKLFGWGTAKIVGDTVSFKDCKESTVCVLTMTFECGEAGDPLVNTFVASFYPSMCRCGYRSLPCSPIVKRITAEKKKIMYGCYVLITLKA